MRWDLPELTEDAMTSYLRVTCGGVHATQAWGEGADAFPRAVVHVSDTGPLSEDEEWSDYRELILTIAVQTEAAPELSTSGEVISTIRERHARAVSAVCDAVFVSDLNARLVAQDIPAIAFSRAKMETTARGVEVSPDGVPHLVTTLTGMVIAEPVTGS